MNSYTVSLWATVEADSIEDAWEVASQLTVVLNEFSECDDSGINDVEELNS